jgi:hypothetical protein
MGGLIVIDIHQRHGVDVVALALRLGTRGFRCLNCSEAERQVGRWRRVMRIVEQPERNAPISDGAPRIGLERLLENFFGRLVPERVLVPHGAVKPSLPGLVA